MQSTTIACWVKGRGHYVQNSKWHLSNKGAGIIFCDVYLLLPRRRIRLQRQKQAAAPPSLPKPYTTYND